MARVKDTSAKARKLDLFQEVFPALDKRNFDFWNSLKEEQRKELSPWLIQRWISSTDASTEWQEYFLQAVNERVNVSMKDLTAHPELQWMLLASCGARKAFRRAWIGTAKAPKKDKIMQFLQELYPAAGEQELELLRALNNETELRDIAESMNIKKSELKEVFGE